jgi:hypothetical protein
VEMLGRWSGPASALDEPPAEAARAPGLAPREPRT